MEKMKDKKCAVCGIKNRLTVHHLRDIHDKVYFNNKNKRKPNCKGFITLCRDCHDLVEVLITKVKLKKMFYKAGYKQGYDDALRKGEFYND